jgi:hypothetical protein
MFLYGENITACKQLFPGRISSGLCCKLIGIICFGRVKWDGPDG